LQDAASAASHVSSGAWCALSLSPRDAIGNHVDANAVGGAECAVDQTEAAAQGEARVVDAMQEGQSWMTSSSVSRRHRGSRAKVWQRTREQKCGSATVGLPVEGREGPL